MAKRVFRERRRERGMRLGLGKGLGGGRDAEASAERETELGYGIELEGGTWSKEGFEFGQGFWYHHVEPHYLMLVYWIPKPAHTLPENTTHRLKIGAFVINQSRESSSFPPEIITYDQWVQMKPKPKNMFSGWMKGHSVVERKRCKNLFIRSLISFLRQHQYCGTGRQFGYASQILK